jgi:hypothetical protein
MHETGACCLCLLNSLLEQIFARSSFHAAVVFNVGPVEAALGWFAHNQY